MKRDANPWDEFRELTLGYVVVCGMAALSLLLVVLVGVYTHHVRPALEIALGAALIWSVPAFIFIRRFMRWRCPRCGEEFVGVGGLLRVLPVTCSHCRQRAFLPLE